MARLANVTKAVSNTYRYVSKQPVGAAVFLIALDLARRVAQSPVGVSVRDAIGSFVGGRAVVLDQMRRDSDGVGCRDHGVCHECHQDGGGTGCCRGGDGSATGGLPQTSEWERSDHQRHPSGCDKFSSVSKDVSSRIPRR
jgi:hypothetical protein